MPVGIKEVEVTIDAVPLPHLSQGVRDALSMKVSMVRNVLHAGRLFIVSAFIVVNVLSGVEIVNKYSKHYINSQLYHNEKYAYEVFTQVPVAQAYKKYDATAYPQIDDYASQSVVVYNLSSDRIMFEKSATRKTLIASLTKMASTKVLLDLVSLEGKTSITAEQAKITGSQLMFKESEEVKNIDLFKSAVIASNNQSVFALYDPETTVEKMNHLAEVLKLQNTHFSNPAGFDDAGNNYSTARDILTIAKVFFSTSPLREYAMTGKTQIETSERSLTVQNTNDLLRLKTPGIIAGKTGTTSAAGQNLVLLLEKNDTQYIAVLLNGNDRYDDAYKILERI